MFMHSNLAAYSKGPLRIQCRKELRNILYSLEWEITAPPPKS